MYLSSNRVSQLIDTKDIKINPFQDSSLLTSSYEIRLGNEFKSVEHIDDSLTNNSGNGFKKYKGSFKLKPRSFVLALSNEMIGISNGLLAFIKSRDSLFDNNYAIHNADGFISNETPKLITLNIFNSSNKSINLYPGMKIGEVVFARRNGKNSV